MEEILIIDGYNIIGAWPELTKFKDNDNLVEARDELLNWLIEYQSYTGKKVIVVFDAYLVAGTGKKNYDKSLTVYYTKENETADELIEKLVKQIQSRKRRVYVATSDYTEQRVVFGQGALRVSARELAIEKDEMKKQIKKNVENYNKKLNKSILLSLDEEKIKFFEKLRRKK